MSVEKMIKDRCVQIMQISPYLSKPESINKLLKFVEVNSFTVNGLHHEIDLSLKIISDSLKEAEQALGLA